jgi:molecular chaperone DnaK (HSP70)
MGRCVMAFGIDFGTTNSEVVHDQGTLLHTGAGRPFPSVFAVDNVTGDFICGLEAKRKAGVLTEGVLTVITSFKRHMDQQFLAGK